jgi:hypothetical protein
MAPRSVRSTYDRSVIGPKISYLEFFRASEDILSRWSRLYLQSLAPIRTGLAWWAMARSPYV